MTQEQLEEYLLQKYDHWLRFADSDYGYGCADATGQSILDTCREQSEAYKRVMHFTNIRNYIKQYPTPIPFVYYKRGKRQE